MKILLATRAVFYKSTMNLPADVGLKMKRTLSGHDVHLNSKNDHDWPDWNDYDAVVYIPFKINLFGGVMQRYHIWVVEQMAKLRPETKLLRLVDDVYHIYTDFIHSGKLNDVPGIDAARSRQFDGVVGVDMSWRSNEELKSVAELPWYWVPYTTVGYRDHVGREFPVYPRRDGTSDCVYAGWNKADRVKVLNELFNTDDYETATFGAKLSPKTRNHANYKLVKLNVMELIYAESGSSIVLGTPEQKNVVTSRFFESALGGSPAIFHDSMRVPGLDWQVSDQPQFLAQLADCLSHRQYWVDKQVAFAKGVIEDHVKLYEDSTYKL